jgi:hypothetical protein
MHSLKWLYDKAALFIAGTTITGPLTYLAGSKLGAATIENTIDFLILAIPAWLVTAVILSLIPRVPPFPKKQLQDA